MNDLEKIDAEETDVTQLDMANAIRFLAIDSVEKANQMIEDLSKKLLVSENAINNTKKQVESLIDLVKKN